MSRITHIGIGEHIRIQRRGGHWQIGPVITHDILQVTAQTATQVTAKNISSAAQYKVRRSDGKVIGRDYDYAEPATAEHIAEYHNQSAASDRHRAAYFRVLRMWDKPVHQLDLNTDQLEHLAKAWDEVQAMAAKPATTTL